MSRSATWSKRALYTSLGICSLLATVVTAGGGNARTALAAATAPTLGTAQSFAVLGGSTVTNTGSSMISGNLGVSPGTAVTGFPPGMVTGGMIHAADPVAAQAQADTATAYNVLAGEPCGTVLTGSDLGGLTLTTGVYCFASSAGLTGTLTLNGQGDPNAVFVFQIGSTLITASNSSVRLINAAQACNVFFQVGSSATLGAGTTFAGNILALASISLVTGASVSGRTLARTGAVSLQTNVVTRPTCTVAPPTATPSPSPSPTVSPTPSPSPSPSATPSPSPSPSATPSPSPSPSASLTPSPSPSPTASPTAGGTAAPGSAGGATGGQPVFPLDLLPALIASLTAPPIASPAAGAGVGPAAGLAAANGGTAVTNAPVPAISPAPIATAIPTASPTLTPVASPTVVAAVSASPGPSNVTPIETAPAATSTPASPASPETAPATATPETAPATTPVTGAPETAPPAATSVTSTSSAGDLVNVPVVVVQQSIKKSQAPSVDEPDSSLVTITGQDYSFDITPSLSVGDIVVNFVNQGSISHSMRLLRLNDGVTFDQVSAAIDAMSSSDPDATVAFFQLVTDIGGVGGVAAGDSQSITLTVSAGNYAVIDLDSVSRAMVTLISVVPVGSSAAP